MPHHQDQIKSPHKLRDGASWGNILSLPSNLLDYDQNKLLTIVENVPEELDPREISQVKKGKRRITDEFASPPTSPCVLNVGFGTPFKSSSQFFTRLGGIPLPSAGTMSQQNILVGLGLPHTLAFEDIPNPRNAHQTQRGNPQIRSCISNPFEGRQLPPHMEQNVQEREDELGQTTSTPASRPNMGTSSNQHQQPETRSDGESSRNRSPSNQRGGNRERHPGGDPEGSDDDDDGDGDPQRNNNNYHHSQPNNDPPPNLPNGGGGGNPGGGGGGNGPSSNGSYPNMQLQGNVPYGNLVATIRNELKQDQLPVWDGNKDTAIEYFWKIQQLAALEGDIPVALGYWLWKSLKENSKIWMWFSVLYTPPHIPVGLQMDSGSVPGLHIDSTYNTIKAIYFMIIHLESIWSLHRLCLDSTRYQRPPYGVDPFTLPCVIKENPNLRQRSCDLI